ncbi:hypothetical protein [Winogradskyella sp. MH6]|uniref:hypothetical protein n=1 Tax=Winogradskyella sp. MH6 TaxID=2929510 RepID=UPI001FB426B2|nr:hypothetical protein [Winogradskyella sp. MH6]
MKKQPVPLKKVIINGLLNGLIFTLLMEVYYHYFTDDKFSLLRVFYYFFAFGVFSALTYRYQYQYRNKK